MIRLLILELLSEQPMSGYEMKQILEKTDASRWGNILPGSIYNALKKLEAEHYIRISKIEMTGNRQRSEYSINEQGREKLKELISEALSSPVSFNGHLYSGIGFAYQLDSKQTISILKKNVAALNKEKNEIEQGIVKKSNTINSELPTLSKIVVSHMIKTIELQKELLFEVIETLEDESD